VITLAVLISLIIYILYKGIPNLKPSLFAWNYNTENVSMMPAIINTLSITAMTLLFSVPAGIFAAIYLVEYAKRGNKFVSVVRMTTETLAGIPSIVFGLFGYVF
jgi:phosphate transport system permease protein